MKVRVFILAIAVSGCSYTTNVETKCYRDGELAYVQEMTVASSATGFGSAQSSSSMKTTYTADWYDPSKPALDLACTSSAVTN